MELDEESRFNREIEIIQKQTEYSIDLQDKSLRNSYGKILDDYQKTLEDDYVLKTKVILKDLENHATRDLKKYVNDLEIEKNVILEAHKKDIVDMEKAYFESKLSFNIIFIIYF